jgi:hypothetical protein
MEPHRLAEERSIAMHAAERAAATIAAADDDDRKSGGPGRAPDAPAELLVSMEADPYPKNHEDGATITLSRPRG